MSPLTTTADGRADTFTQTIRRTLERPLASYQLMLGSVGLLVGLGLIMVLSASSILARELYGNSFAIFIRQLVFVLLGLAAAWLASRAPLPLIRRVALPALIVSCLMVVLTYIPGVGVEVNGNRNWIPLPGGFQLQPSEFAKLSLILWMAHHYASRETWERDPRYLITPSLPVGAAVSALVLGQGDMGTAAVLFVIVAALVWFAGLPGKYMSVLLAGMAVVSALFVAIAPHRVSRFLVFLNPLADPENTGYQSIHAMMGFARGGFWGVGLGYSRQKWGSLPEAHTDFILAIIGEELGLMGSIVVLALFVGFAIAGVRIALRTRDTFVRLAAAGITVWITTQATINIAMVLGLAPVIGIPLPFISYGGSSMVITMIAVGLMLNFATTEPGARRSLMAARSRRVRRNAARKR